MYGHLMYSLICCMLSYFRRHHGSSAKAVFELKPEYESECTPFYYHYTKPDHSKVK